MITLVIFSMNRAMQLDSLLRSVEDHCSGIDSIWVLARATSPLHVTAYNQLNFTRRAPDKYRHPPVTFVHEEEMPRELASCSKVLAWPLDQAKDGHVALTVDDQIFYASSDFAAAARALDTENGFVWSWRLGKPKLHPEGRLYSKRSSLITAPDYRYLFHSDGALYRTNSYTAVLDRCLPDWRSGRYNPNQLEDAGASRIAAWSHTVGPHLSPLSPTCCTWQINKQRPDPYGAPYFAVPETELHALAVAYLEGKRVDNDRLYADTSWTSRFNEPDAPEGHVRACEEAARFYAGLIR